MNSHLNVQILGHVQIKDLLLDVFMQKHCKTYWSNIKSDHYNFLSNVTSTTNE